jgi:hypothetical protein
MGQTILDEYLANIEEDDDNNLPDPKPFGFSSIATMLSEAVEVMEQQAESNRELRRKLDKAEQLAATRNEDIGRLQGELKQATARIAELEAQMSLKWPGVWQQLIADEEHIRRHKTIRIQNEGRFIELEDDDGRIGAWLDELGCAICRKIQPAA